MSETERYEKITGPRHILAAGTYSYGGFRQLLGETAFRQEVALFAIVIGLFIYFGAGLSEFLIATCLFLILIAVEALNTAIEVLVDRISPEISDFAKQAKDLGSFAVFCMLLANGIFAAQVILPALI